jgi:O-antigen/teichoic acid export membrane protein
MKLLEKTETVFAATSHTREILIGSGWSFMFKVLALGLGYISTLIISNFFGARVVGLFNLSATVVTIVVMFCLMGFPTSILRFVGEYQGDRAIISILVRMILISIFTSFPFLIVGFIFADEISIHAFHDERLKDFLRVMFVGIPFVVVTNILIEFIRGLRLIRVSETLRNSNVLFSLPAIVILVFLLKFNDLTPAVAYLFASIAVFTIAVFYVQKTVKKLEFYKNTAIQYKKIIKVSLPMLMTASMFLITGSVDKLMLGYFMGPKEVGIYSVAFRVAALTSMILMAINTIVAPKMAELYWAKRYNELKNMVRFSAKLIFFLSFPILLCFIIFAKPILSLFGQEFVAGKWVLITISAGEFINATTGPVGYFLDMTGLQVVRRNLVFLYMLMNVSLNYILIPEYGYNGAAVATAFTQGLFNIAALIYVWVKRGIFTGYIPFVRFGQGDVQ